MGIGWAYIDCDPEFVTGAFGPTGSVMFKDGHRSIRGADELMWIRPGAEAEGYTAATAGDWNPSFLQVSGNVRVSGTVYANNFDVVTTTLTEIHQSGSTSFGQGVNRDRHSFTGSIQVTGANTAGDTVQNSYILDRFGIGSTMPQSRPHSIGSSKDAKFEVFVTATEALTGMVLDCNDVDEVGFHITGSQTTANVLEITADAVTTANVIDISADSLTTGAGLYIDDNSSYHTPRNTVDIRQNDASALGATALNILSDGGGIGIALDKNYEGANAATIKGISVDVDKTVNTNTNNTIIGVDIDVDNTTAVDGVNTMTGLKVTPTLQHASDAGTPTVLGASVIATGHTNGTSTATAMELTSTGADTNRGLVINCADGGTDLVILSSADVDDMFKVEVGAAGATTITTVDDGGHAADLTFTIDGAIKLDGDGVEIENDSDSGVPALLIDNDDVDQFALQIDAANTTVNAIEIVGDSVTTAKVVNISADALTQGNALFVKDDSSSAVTRATAQIEQLNADATGATGLHVRSDSRGGVAGIRIDRNADGTAAVDAVMGLKIDLDQTGEITSATGVVVGIQTDVETNVAGDGTLNSFGHRIVMTGDTDGTHTNTGLSINVGQTDTNTHIELLSSADVDDKCTLAVGAAGLTTITTVDDGGTGANLQFTIDGAINFTPAGLNVTMTDESNVTVFDFNLADPTFKIADDADEGDFFSINVGAAGATTITTVDDDGATANLTFAIDGDILLNLPANDGVIPSNDNSIDLGSAAKRYANIHTAISHVGDLHLENDRGNWLIVEEENYLSIRNQKTGKLFKFVLEEIEE
tara:strand:+ start:13896 stop:16349 length:2454 start_codon:yes stop_codon:yes gene_type:complete